MISFHGVFHDSIHVFNLRVHLGPFQNSLTTLRFVLNILHDFSLYYMYIFVL
jgi:hypothetical protein